MRHRWGDDLVYHASPRAGIVTFETFLYWVIQDGTTGRVRVDSTVPSSAATFQGFFATGRYYLPMFFAPFSVKRIYASKKTTLHQLSICLRCRVRRRCLIFAASDRRVLEKHGFSIYAFPMELFVQLPAGEYVSYAKQKPLWERAYVDVLANLRREGVDVFFVEALGPILAELKKKGVPFSTQGL
jgi:hypothetical protein